MRDKFSLSELVEIIVLQKNNGIFTSDEQKILEALKEAEKYLAEQLINEKDNRWG